MKGIYVLLLNVEKKIKAHIGRLGQNCFEQGLYLYVGSALGAGSTSLEYRLKRHATKNKKKFWHIDYFTSQPCVKLLEAFYFKSQIKVECEIRKILLEKLGGKVAHPSFGSTDCRCGGHLIYLNKFGSKDQVIEKIIELKGYRLKPFI